MLDGWRLSGGFCAIRLIQSIKQKYWALQTDTEKYL